MMSKENNVIINNVAISYEDTFESLKWVFENKLKKMGEEEQLEYMKMFKTYLDNTIYGILLVNKNNEKEEYIRKLCKYVIKYLLPFTNSKISYYNSKKNPQNNNDFLMTNKELLIFNDWLDLEDDFFAIASMRSLTHFALYLERDDPLDQKVWCYILNDVMGGIFYYANQMILNKKYQNLFKQCPTGYGKCFSVDSDILTKDGYKKIKDIKIGDYVYSMGENNNVTLRKIKNIWYSEKEQYKIKARNGAEIVVSPEHRMFTQRGYVQAKDLSTEDCLNAINYSKELLSNFKKLKKLLNNDNNNNNNNNERKSDFLWNKITSIEKSNKKIQMADIEVEETHNFILNGFVSHNSKSDCDIICYILGYDPNASIMKVVGNPRLVGEITENVIKMLQNDRFLKVFKNYKKIVDKNKNKDEIFETISRKDGVFKIKGSKKARSFLCVNKDTDIDGTRYDYQFFDDITQSKDRENITKHLSDIAKFTGQWKKRASSEFNTIRFFTGTAYHYEDFLSYTKKFYAKKQPLIRDLETINFKWSKFVKLSSDKKTVYVIVKKLADLEYGEDKCYCTFPQKYSKQEALEMYHGNLGSKREFYAMEQQEPLPPETLPFDYAYLNTYSRLPQDILDKKCESKIIIDPNRRGIDNFSALIMDKSSIENIDKFYFTDCYYEKTSAKIAIPEIVKLIIKHNVSIIYIETNIDCVELLEQQLRANQYTDYEIKEFYTSENKKEKIATQKDNIIENIIFPIQGMYYYESPMGRAMKDITSYSLVNNKGNDDSIDCCAMFVKQEEKSSENTTEFLDIDFRF